MEKIKEQIINFIKIVKSEYEIITDEEIQIPAESIEEQKKFKYSRNVEYPGNKKEC